MKLICLFAAFVSVFSDRECTMNGISEYVREAGRSMGFLLRFTCRHRQKAREFALYNYRGDPKALIEEFLLGTHEDIIARRLWLKFKVIDRRVEKVYFACFTGKTSIACASSHVLLDYYQHYPNINKDEDANER